MVPYTAACSAFQEETGDKTLNGTMPSEDQLPLSGKMITSDLSILKLSIIIFTGLTTILDVDLLFLPKWDCLHHHPCHHLTKWLIYYNDFARDQFKVILWNPLIFLVNASLWYSQTEPLEYIIKAVSIEIISCWGALSSRL